MLSTNFAKEQMRFISKLPPIGDPPPRRLLGRNAVGMMQRSHRLWTNPCSAGEGIVSANRRGKMVCFERKLREILLREIRYSCLVVVGLVVVVSLKVFPGLL